MVASRSLPRSRGETLLDMKIQSGGNGAQRIFCSLFENICHRVGNHCAGQWLAPVEAERHPRLALQQDTVALPHPRSNFRNVARQHRTKYLGVIAIKLRAD